MAQQDLAREVRDYQQICGLRSAYSHAIDRAIDTGDWDEFVSLYANDAVVDYPQETLRGRDEIEAFGRGLEEMYEFSVHTAQMPRIDIDRDEAAGRWYMLVFYIATDGSEGYVLGWYDDEYRRIDGEWKFDRIAANVTRDTDGFHV
ncbi:nuclear transport factor 2 family protein [Natrialbaceae archaeon GCM10025810]|uniref:nuclear transport factor 2 family protein n=1 Tax=Halovalidus salilacus TaxID=3075124 RepID=UPI003620497B